MISMASGQDINIVRPFFIESAAFFLSGAEWPSNDISHPTTITVDEPGDVLQRVTYQASLAKPCSVYEIQEVPPYIIRLWNFDNFPGPHSETLHGNGPGIDFGKNVVWEARRQSQSPGTFVEATEKPVPGSLKILTSGTFIITSNLYRRLAALHYIRDNFCAGLPEPPQAPLTIKPY
jgi:hypothetical protein